MVKWDLSKIYDFGKTEELITQLSERVKQAKSYREELKEDISEESFLKILKDIENLSVLSSKISGYASLWLSEKTDSSERNTHHAKISQILTELGNELIFFGLWFKKLDEKNAKRLINESGKYSYHLSTIRRFKDYSLKENEEKLLNIKDLTGDEASIRYYDIITNGFLFDFKGEKLTQSDITPLFRDPKPETRELAYKTIFEKYQENEPILGEIYKVLVQDWANDNIKIRGFKTPISIRNLGNDVDDKTVETLLEVIKKNISIFQEYFQLKAKLLNLEKMSRFHLYAPIEESSKEVSYEESKEIVLSTFKTFSEKAYEYAKEIFDSDHVYSDIEKGKQSGAFCATINKNMNPFILLNYKNKVSDLSTMMHEFGHGIHGRAARDQTQFTFHSALPMAETASIFSETLLEKRMLKEAADKDKISILAKGLDDRYASIIRQAYFIIFEIKAHELIEKGATIEQLNELYLSTLKEQFGDSVELPEIFQHEWKYVPHIYHTPFYCYAYAFGNLLALTLYKLYEEDNSFADKFMKILESGGSDKPFNIIKDTTGMDITKTEFWQKGFDSIKEDLEELKKLL